MSKAFLVHKMKTEIAVNVLGKSVPLTVADMADGCVGVSLWFDTMEHAVEYGGADAEYSQGEVSDTVVSDSQSQDKPLKSDPTTKKEDYK